MFFNVKIPYKVKRAFSCDGLRYAIGDIFLYPIKVARYKRFLIAKMIEEAPHEECKFYANIRLNINDIEYKVGEEIDIENFDNLRNCLLNGSIRKVFVQETEDKKEEIKKAVEEVQQNIKVKYKNYVELAKAYNMKPKELIKKLKDKFENLEIKTHMASVDEDMFLEIIAFLEENKEG